jgi:uncharacterized DUF497 family protein
VHIRKLLWSQTVIEKLQTKHQVSPPEVKAVCAGMHFAWTGRQGTHYLLGQTKSGRYLFVVLTHKGHGVFRVATARDMTEAERKRFKKRKL